jgi:hypothetical protein
MTWTHAQLRDQIQRAGTSDRPLTAGRQGGRTVTTTESNITKDMTPLEAANLLEKLEEGQQAAWLSTHQVPWHSAEYQSRFQNAAEVDDVFRDLMWETVEIGMRRPGEPVEEFAERAESEAELTDGRKAGAEPPAGPIIQQADAEMTRNVPGGSQDEIAVRRLSDTSTPESQAYARVFSDSAAAYVRELRKRDRLPEPDRTPGAPHPDSFLAGRGWHVNEHGIYTRRAQPEAQAPAARELEAGS